MGKAEVIDNAVKQLGEAINSCFLQNEENSEMNKILTPRQLCERWEKMISEKTLANWRHTGEGPEYIKIGGKIAYLIESVEQYEEKRRRKAFPAR